MSETFLDDLAHRFQKLVIARLRQDGLDSLQMFLDSQESGMGGTLGILAQCKQPDRKRAIPEAAFRTERHADVFFG